MEKTYKFYLPQNKEVKSTNVRVENGEVLVDVVFKDKFQPKDGDFLHDKYCDITVIYKETHQTGGIITYAGINKDNIVCETGKGFGITKEYRYATPEEKAAFLERLEKGYNKRWNAEKKCLEDIYVPKFGDIVRIEYPDIKVFKRDYVISIFPNKKVPVKTNECFFDIATINMDGSINIKDSHATYNHNHVFLATESEKQELFDKLAEVGKRWNPETKQLEDIRWIPTNGENYWYITEDLEVAFAKYDDMNNLHVFRAHVNNCFKTPEATSKVFKQIKEIFNNSKAE